MANFCGGHRQHARNIGVRLLHRDARLQAGNALTTETEEPDRGAIETQGNEEREFAIHELERGGSTPMIS